MGFFDIPFPKTIEAFEEQIKWINTLITDAERIKYPAQTIDMLKNLKEFWINNLEKLRDSQSKD